jgi:putative DNA methylase
MTWDYAEGNPFSSSTGNWTSAIAWSEKFLAAHGFGLSGIPSQTDARAQSISLNKVVSTDPPYYDNVGYADLSDFFYVWLRRALKTVFSEIFATLTAPKMEELVATPARHGGQALAEAFFLEGMTEAMHCVAEQSHPSCPITIYYAFKQAENSTDSGGRSTGWETFLDAVMRAGLAVTGTWPIRTERLGRLRDSGSNALASSIVHVCRRRASNAPRATLRDFRAALQLELPEALVHLQRSNIAPVDLAQAAIGPGMAVFTRYSEVLGAGGNRMTVPEALARINETLDEILTQQEGDFEPDSRWALAWFEEFGFKEGPYGKAEQLSKSKGTSVDGLQRAGVLIAKGGKVRLLSPGELPADWDPSRDARLTAWEAVHHLVRALDHGERAAAALFQKLGNAKAEVARELAYRLYTLCERKKRAQEALAYNALVQSWPELMRLARGGVEADSAQLGLAGLDE